MREDSPGLPGSSPEVGKILLHFPLQLQKSDSGHLSPLQSPQPAALPGVVERGSPVEKGGGDTSQIDTLLTFLPKSLRNFLARRKGSVQKMKDRGLV